MMYAQPQMMMVPGQPMMMAPQPYPQNPGFIQNVKSMPKKKKGCCACFCCLLLLILITAIVALILKLGQCSTLDHDREWTIEDVSSGFEIRSMKGTFQTVQCETCITPELHIIQRNSRDVFPEPNTNTTDDDGIYKFVAEESHLNWFIDCYTTDVTLYVPLLNAKIPYIKVDFDVGFITKDYDHKDSVHMDVDLEVAHFDLIVRKESALIKKLVTQQVVLDTTVKATLTLKEIDSELEKECKVKTNFGTQSLDASFASGATGFNIEMTSGTGNARLTLNNKSSTGGKLKVIREQNGEDKRFSLDGKSTETPYEQDWGEHATDENNVSISLKSRMEPGKVTVQLED
ncbi:hypothetical protein P9112_001902 [Eukaryota sp. TZLM1-RC]